MTTFDMWANGLYYVHRLEQGKGAKVVLVSVNGLVLRKVPHRRTT
ncbi:hypothetical protein F7D08_1651 [Bifidobacterium cebidarum]|uniref:Uncharacterized protein n=1 Tax=Bifidobacterium cebidarum TaxID=2650773 RepID=A0A6I1G7V1_9BIFI|nr:hypothetical protein F7D08_1651 [Bifidobacterium cebidarum]